MMEEAKNTATQENIDVQQRARAGKARIAAIIASIVAVASLAFGGCSQYQQFQLNDGYQQVLESESQLLAEKSSDLLALGDRYGAIQTALSALPESSESGGHCIAAVTCTGDTLTCSPRTFAQKMESNAHGGRNIGELCEAYLLERDGTWYLSAWRENPVWHVVYRNVVLADAPEEHDAPQLDELIAQAHEMLDAHEAAEAAAVGAGAIDG